MLSPNHEYYYLKTVHSVIDNSHMHSHMIHTVCLCLNIHSLLIHTHISILLHMVVEMQHHSYSYQCAHLLVPY